MPCCLRPSVYGPWSTTQYSCVRRTRRPLWLCVRKATFCSFFGPVIAKRPGVLGEQEGCLLVIFPCPEGAAPGAPSFRGSLAAVFLPRAVWVPSSPSLHVRPSGLLLPWGPCCPLDSGLAASHCLDSSSALVRRLSIRRKQNIRPGGPSPCPLLALPPGIRRPGLGSLALSAGVWVLPRSLGSCAPPNSPVLRDPSPCHLLIKQVTRRSRVKTQVDVKRQRSQIEREQQNT